MYKVHHVGVRSVAMFVMLEMSNGTKYRVLVEFEELKQTVDQALKAGGLITLPMGINPPGTPVTLNPQHVVAVGGPAS
jgi:hypothetical protein